MTGFAAAQAAYDRQEDPRYWEPPLGDCSQCGGDECVERVDGGRRGSIWWIETKCTKCGHVHKDDNFDEANDQ